MTSDEREKQEAGARGEKAGGEDGDKMSHMDVDEEPRTGGSPFGRLDTAVPSCVRAGSDRRYSGAAAPYPFTAFMAISE